MAGAPARLAAALLVVAASAAACNRTNEPAPPNAAPAGPVATAGDGSVVFPAPEDGAAAIKRAGLALLPPGQGEVHQHAHVEVIIEGKAVTVPAGIGVARDAETTRLSPVHTTDDSGVVHLVATAPDAKFRVSQLFRQWGVELTKSCIDRFCADDPARCPVPSGCQLLAFADGELAADPSSVPLSDHLQVVIWFGPKGVNPPVATTYDFSTVREATVPVTSTTH